MDIVTLISQFGFPVAACVFCGFFIYKIWQQSNKDTLERELSYRKTIDEYNKQLQKNNGALMKITTILDEICNRLEKLEDKTK